MGDPIKLVMLEKVLDVIKREKLIKKVNQTGEYLMGHLQKLEKANPGLIEKSRGRGTFIAFDILQNKREQFQKQMMQKGK